MGTEAKEDGIMRTLSDIRREIDSIDDELTILFVKRMRAVDEIVAIKRGGQGVVFDKKREAEILDRAVKLVDSDVADDTRDFLQGILAISRARQIRFL